MEIRFLVRLEDGGATAFLQRRVERPYTGVPRRGDSVFLGDEGGGSTPALVADVTWENDGLITLSIDLPGSYAAELEQLGFERL